MPAVDLKELVRPGDTVLWGQASAEPLALTTALVSQRHGLGGVRCVLGMPADGTAIRPDAVDGLDLVSWCGTGLNGRLHAAGHLTVVPAPYAQLPALFGTGPLAADVVMVAVSAPDAAGRHSLGLADDYLGPALEHARVILAEVNDQVPAVPGARTLTAADWAAAVHTSRPPAVTPDPAPGPDVLAVAARVADLIDDGATLQFGIGALPGAVLRALTDRRDLGIHTGLLVDGAYDLIASGAVTGARKTVDRGLVVAGLVAGSDPLFRWVDRNPEMWMRDIAYTHDPSVLAAQHRLVAINSALEVDLTGQVGAEQIGERYVGAVGGAGEFLRGAARSPSGLPVIALPSTARGTSRIVPRLAGPVSTTRGDAGLVVTEHGVADLRGATLPQRAERLLAVAHPDHRDALAAEVGPLLDRMAGGTRGG